MNVIWNSHLLSVEKLLPINHKHTIVFRFYMQFFDSHKWAMNFSNETSLRFSAISKCPSPIHHFIFYQFIVFLLLCFQCFPRDGEKVNRMAMSSVFAYIFPVSNRNSNTNAQLTLPHNEGKKIIILRTCLPATILDHKAFFGEYLDFSTLFSISGLKNVVTHSRQANLSLFYLWERYFCVYLMT